MLSDIVWRDEVKVGGSVQVDKVLSLLEGGSSYNSTQLLFEAVAELRKTNDIMSEAARSMYKLVNAVLGRKPGQG